MTTDARTLALQEMTAPGAPFAVLDDDVLGVRLPVFATRHRNLRELLASSARYGDAEYFTLGDEVLTFSCRRAPGAHFAVSPSRGRPRASTFCGIVSTEPAAVRVPVAPPARLAPGRTA